MTAYFVSMSVTLAAMVAYFDSPLATLASTTAYLVSMLNTLDSKVAYFDSPLATLASMAASLFHC